MAWPKVYPGSRLRIPASLQNRLIDLASGARAPGVGRGSPLLAVPPYTAVLGRNAEATSLPAFGVARATASTFDPAENLSAFLSRPVLDLEVAGEDNLEAPLVVATNRIKAGRVGGVAIAGLIQTRIVVTDADHDAAAPSTSVAWQLDSAEAGVPIVWKESGTGTKWALLLLTGTTSTRTPATVLTARITGATETGTGDRRYKYDWTEVEPAATPGQWADVPGGLNSSADGLLYNGLEAPNASAGVLGSGVDVDNLIGTFEAVPLGTGAVVEISGPFGSSPQWWQTFASTQVDGGCA